MRKTKLSLLVLVIGCALLATSCAQNVEAPKKWEKVGSLSQADLLNIKIAAYEAPIRYVGYHSEIDCLTDFPQLLVNSGYSETDVQNALRCYQTIAWKNNDANLDPAVKSCMNEGRYPILLLIIIDPNTSAINGVVINKKSVGSFYFGAMAMNDYGNWVDITGSL